MQPAPLAHILFSQNLQMTVLYPLGGMSQGWHVCVCWFQLACRSKTARAREKRRAEREERERRERERRERGERVE